MYTDREIIHPPPPPLEIKLIGEIHAILPRGGVSPAKTRANFASLKIGWGDYLALSLQVMKEATIPSANDLLLAPHLRVIRFRR